MRYLMVGIGIVVVALLTGWYVQTQPTTATGSAEAESVARQLQVYESTLGVGEGDSATQTGPATALAQAAPVPVAILVEQAAASPEEAEPSTVASVSAPVVKRNPGGAVGQMAVVRAGGAELLASPVGALLMTLPTGASLNALAVTDDRGWLHVRVVEGVDGWVESDRILLFNDAALPVAPTDAGAAPTALAGEGIPATVGPAAGPTMPTDLAEAALATVALTGSRLNMRSGPGADFPIVAKALPNEVYAAVARNATGDWVQLRNPQLAGAPAWVSAEFVTLSIPLAKLPIPDEF
ncbi:MAG: SH3 domain-containing protein [Caldilineaceae bacterium]|nr:SH3 domain-containing protein [Caldilineaceae bacterium]